MALRCVAAAAGPDAASVATVVAAETGRLLARAGPGRAGYGSAVEIAGAAAVAAAAARPVASRLACPCPEYTDSKRRAREQRTDGSRPAPPRPDRGAAAGSTQWPG